MNDIQQLYQQLILEHNRNPKNFKEIDHADCELEGYNPLCGDQITIYLNLEDDVITDIGFQGKGCAISKASASIMTTMLKGKTKAEALVIFDKFHKMVTDGTVQEDFGKLEVLAGVHKFPSRVKCAILAWHTTVQALDNLHLEKTCKY